MNDKAVLIISLDFELYWGVSDKVKLEDKQQYFQNTRTTIPALLNLFDQNQIHVTWATVGMLFATGWREWYKFMPKEKPNYNNNNLSSYAVEAKYNNANHLEPFLFAPDIVDLINETPNQEVATHTFCHYYCKESGQTISQFRHDLQAAKIIAAQKNISLHSLVFPRNQYNVSYLKVCTEEGITSVRSNPQDWFWRDTESEVLVNKIFRTGDSYIQLGKRTSFKLSSLDLKDGLPLSIPASRFMRPVGNSAYLNKLRLRRILAEMTAAAERQECYHLWWHPHNFGDYPEESINDLQHIVEHFKRLQHKYGMVSMNMKEVNSYIKNNNEHDKAL